MTKNLKETITYAEFDDLGNIKRVQGKCLARDMQNQVLPKSFSDSDFCLCLNIRRID